MTSSTSQQGLPDRLHPSRLSNDDKTDKDTDNGKGMKRGAKYSNSKQNASLADVHSAVKLATAWETSLADMRRELSGLSASLCQHWKCEHDLITELRTFASCPFCAHHSEATSTHRRARIFAHLTDHMHVAEVEQYRRLAQLDDALLAMERNVLSLAAVYEEKFDGLSGAFAALQRERDATLDKIHAVETQHARHQTEQTAATRAEHERVRAQHFVETAKLQKQLELERQCREQQDRTLDRERAEAARQRDDFKRKSRALKVALSTEQSRATRADQMLRDKIEATTAEQEHSRHEAREEHEWLLGKLRAVESELYEAKRSTTSAHSQLAERVRHAEHENSELVRELDAVEKERPHRAELDAIAKHLTEVEAARDALSDKLKTVKFKKRQLYDRLNETEKREQRIVGELEALRNDVAAKSAELERQNTALDRAHTQSKSLAGKLNDAKTNLNATRLDSAHAQQRMDEEIKELQEKNVCLSVSNKNLKQYVDFLRLSYQSVFSGAGSGSSAALPPLPTDSEKFGSLL